MARDNFSSATILKLQKRVNSRCSKPTCRVPTHAPQKGSDGAITIGVAAHICAASPGGPRYDNEMSTKDRKSVANGIWLCSNCSAEIDRNSNDFSVELLREWKTQAEFKATQELGNKLPDVNDGQELLISAFSGNQKKLIPNAIANIHNAAASSLESLDPRFKITSQYIDGSTHFEIHAREEANIQMHIKAEESVNFEDQLQKLQSQGKDFEIACSAISFTGSKLFEEILSNQPAGVFKLKAPKKLAVVRLAVKSPIDNSIEYFEDIQGKLSIGSSEMSFEGYACKKIFKLEMPLNLNKKTSVTMSIDLESWQGIDVRVLPYLDRLFSFFDKLVTGSVLIATLQVDGNDVYTSNTADMSKIDFIKMLASFLKYTKSAKEIATFINQPVLFISDVSYSIDEYLNILEIARTIKDESIFYEKDFNSYPSCQLTIDENFSALQKCTTPAEFKMIGSDSSKVSLFNQEVLLPPLCYIFENVTLKLKPKKKKMRPGDQVKLILVPTHASRMIKSYLQNLIPVKTII
jgi:hypothetical protein